MRQPGDRRQVILTHHNRFATQFEELEQAVLIPLEQEFISIEDYITTYLTHFARLDNAETRAEVRADLDWYDPLHPFYFDFGGELGVVILINNDFRRDFDDFAANGREPSETFIPIEEYITRFLAYHEQPDNYETRAAVRADLDWWNVLNSILVDLGGETGLVVLMPGD